MKSLACLLKNWFQFHERNVKLKASIFRRIRQVAYVYFFKTSSTYMAFDVRSLISYRAVITAFRVG